VDDLAIDDATIITPTASLTGSLSVASGRFAAIGGERRPASARVDAAGLMLLPGFVDTHVHLMAPAQPEREDWRHGSAAAAVSGVTTLVEHTHAQPMLRVADLADKVSYAETHAGVDFGLAAHAWDGDVPEFAGLWATGVAFF
jgi:dihydroorotase-like cyclic amidohydrolase